MVTVTPKAQAMLRELLDQAAPDVTMIRIFVHGFG